ncbi:iron-sulfur cluster biosynthesis family protein [Weissella viridescens]|uniref:Core domain-containing protein n=1 Tax=Weissella viridescens TaxID=1629 RepID=A0A0R2HAS0_WEIVI|nr:iron-sulfur cluster biosynthesis family protein [Weissella viridescens]KRN47180.1 hypothetical protein IV50_GL000452 [Weissella viridescens]QOD85713.1 iron-sulfur cluster biosynthesis family protein [Weissella viridescens]GEA94736.1 hypothetical protein WVI01_06590 [Weissella viridescens]SUP59514.1 Uncharacterised protein [Weissella viridescens]
MKLTFTDAAKTMVQKHLKDDTKIVLDFDDGVGPFSDEATCTLDLAFHLVLARPDQITKDFNDTIESNLGDVYVKGYSEDQMDPNMTLDVDKYLNLSLKGDGGTLDDHVVLVDVQDK